MNKDKVFEEVRWTIQVIPWIFLATSLFVLFLGATSVFHKTNKSKTFIEGR